MFLFTDSPFFAIFILVIFIGVFFATYYFSSKKVILRTLSKIPTKPVASLKPNELVKVSGKALHVKDPLIAPYSKRECIFYTIKIEQRVKSGKSSSWKNLITETKFQEFFMEVNGEMIIIEPTENPKNYISYLVFDKNEHSGVFNNPTTRFKELLQLYNIDSKNFLGLNKNLRYKEGIISIGEQITVAGIAKWRTMQEPLPEYPYSKIASLVAEDKQKLIITDLPEALEVKRRR